MLDMVAHPVAKRILHSFAANITGQGINVAQQILMIPLFASVWGVEIYGEWTVISTVPNYLGLCDFGLGRAAATKLALIAGDDNRQAANEIYNTSVAGMLLLLGIVALLTPFLCLGVPLDAWLNLHQLSAQEIKLTTILLVWGVLLQINFNGALAIFSCDGLQAFGAALGTAQRGFEVAISVAVLFLRQPPWLLAFVIVLIRVISIGCLAFCVWIKLPWVKAGWSLIKWHNLIGLISPSIGNMLFPFAMSINLQGLIMVVSILFGPEHVVIFQTTRVITRSLLQWSESIKRSVRTEISVAYGSGDLPLAASLYRKACRAGFWSTLFWAVVLSALAAPMFRVLIRGKEPFNGALYYSLMLVVLLNSFWFLGAVILDATNRIIQFSAAYLVVSVLSVVLSYLFMSSFGFSAAAYGTMICDALMIYIALGKSLQLLDEKTVTFVRYVFFPWRMSPASAAS